MGPRWKRATSPYRWNDSRNRRMGSRLTSGKLPSSGCPRGPGPGLPAHRPTSARRGQEAADWAAVVAVDGAGAVQASDALAQREARAWPDLAFEAPRNGDGNAGGHERPLPWSERYAGVRPQVHASGTLRRVGGQGERFAASGGDAHHVDLEGHGPSQNCTSSGGRSGPFSSRSIKYASPIPRQETPSWLRKAESASSAPLRSSRRRRGSRAWISTARSTTARSPTPTASGRSRRSGSPGSRNGTRSRSGTSTPPRRSGSSAA